VKIAFLTVLLIMAGTVFAQTDVPRTTTAITYPLEDTLQVQFRGTTRFPRMTGQATVRRTGKSGTKVTMTLEKMPRPFELGSGYATYVLWAISPDGQVDNLGEIRRRGMFEFNSRIEATTPLQIFALIVTAEPHFLVRRPSRAVMLENISAANLEGKNVARTKTVQYLGNSSDYFRSAFVPEIAEIDYQKTPPTILQAQQAIALATFAGAGRDATQELAEAEAYLKDAENSWKADRPNEDVDIKARQSISAAVKAEELAAERKAAREKRNETARRDAEIRKIEDQLADKDEEITTLKAELARETRARELAERDGQNYTQQLKDLRNEVAQLKADLEKSRNETREAQLKLARMEGEKIASDKQRHDDERRQKIAGQNAQLIQALKVFGSVRENGSGVTVTLPENYFTGPRLVNIANSSNGKLDRLAATLAGYGDYMIRIESHTDDKGTQSELETLTRSRAEKIAEKLYAQGVTDERLEVRGQGASLPLVANTTLANRAKNRRVEITLTPIQAGN
jgi:outer membrane protein OmpA-like peptidoglycan-associated protein